jgi:hypothetical protein
VSRADDDEPVATIQIDGRPVPVDLVIEVATALRDTGSLPVWRPDASAMWDVEVTAWDSSDTVHASAAGADLVERAMLRWRLHAGAHARMSRGAT